MSETQAGIILGLALGVLITAGIIVMLQINAFDRFKRWRL